MAENGRAAPHIPLAASGLTVQKIQEEALRACANACEREALDNKAEIYAIFVTTEHLERAFVRDCISHDEYAVICNRLIAQFKTCRTALGSEFDVRAFFSEYDLRCPLALHRLLDAGIPATSEHTAAGAVGGANISKYVAESVQHYITLLDALKLNMTAVDQIQPQLVDLMQSLNRVTLLPPTYEGRVKVLAWLKRLNQMRASDELLADDARQLAFDLESALSEFHRCLSGGNS